MDLPANLQKFSGGLIGMFSEKSPGIVRKNPGKILGKIMKNLAEKAENFYLNLPENFSVGLPFFSRHFPVKNVKNHREFYANFSEKSVENLQEFCRNFSETFSDFSPQIFPRFRLHF